MKIVQRTVAAPNSLILHKPACHDQVSEVAVVEARVEAVQAATPPLGASQMLSRMQQNHHTVSSDVRHRMNSRSSTLNAND